MRSRLGCARRLYQQWFEWKSGKRARFQQVHGLFATLKSWIQAIYSARYVLVNSSIPVDASGGLPT